MFSRLHQILTASKSNRNLWKTVGAQRRQCGSKIIKAKSYNFTGKAHLQKVISNIHTRQGTYRDVAFRLCRYLLEACLYKHCGTLEMGTVLSFHSCLSYFLLPLTNGHLFDTHSRHIWTRVAEYLYRHTRGYFLWCQAKFT